LRAARDEPYVAVGAVTRRLDLLLCGETRHHPKEPDEESRPAKSQTERSGCPNRG
jgi:hypothetical protein